jgi:hypothetical protein
LNAELRTIGGGNFMRKYIQEDQKYPFKDLLYAFGYLLVSFALEPRLY